MKRIFFTAALLLFFAALVAQQRPDSNSFVQIKDMGRMFRLLKKPGTDSVFAITVINAGDTLWVFRYKDEAGSAISNTDWVDILNKPTTFTPTIHNHTVAEISTLQSILDDKAATIHNHSIAEITNLQNNLDGKQAVGNYANSVHTHVPADIIGLPTGTDPFTYLTLPINSTVSTTTYTSVSGMSFTASANTKYLIRLTGAYQTAATTTGIGLAVDIPSGTINGQIIVSISATSNNTLEQIADANTTGVATGVRAANTNAPISGWWVVTIGATGGLVQLMQRSEVAASNTVLQSGLTILEYRTIL